MTVLTKNEIQEFITQKKINFSPNLDAFQIQPHAVDLRLGWTFYIPKSWELTKNGRQALNIDYLNISKNKKYFEIIKLKPGQYFEILPNESIIGVTLEKIAINDLSLMAVLYPRSSFNRRGLSVSLTGIIDAGYKGNLVLPIQNKTNNQIIRIYPGERICQIVFEELKSNLTKQQANLHGLQKPKYINSSENDIIYQNKHRQKEADIEIELIKKGKIDLIKQKYKI